jgi:microcystin-dependent protein
MNSRRREFLEKPETAPVATHRYLLVDVTGSGGSYFPTSRDFTLSWSEQTVEEMIQDEADRIDYRLDQHNISNNARFDALEGDLGNYIVYNEARVSGISGVMAAHISQNDADIQALGIAITDSGSSQSSSLSLAVPPGAIQAYAGPSAPNSGWFICNGALASKTTDAALFAAIGGTGSENVFKWGAQPDAPTGYFYIPNLSGKVVAMVGGTLGSVGDSGGTETHTLAVTELPSHVHSGTSAGTNSVLAHQVNDPTHAHTENANSGPGSGTVHQQASGDVVAGVSEQTTTAVATGITVTDPNSGSVNHLDHSHNFTTDVGSGSGLPHNNMPPYLVLNYIIKR